MGPLLGLAGKWNWFFDFFSHFRPQQTLLLLIAILWLIFAGHFGKATAAFFVFLLCCNSLKNYFLKPYSEVVSPKSVFEFSVFLANVYAKNKQHERVIRLIQKESPDIVVLLEIDEVWEKSLKESMTDYEIRKVLPREGFYGLAIFSKIPLKLIQEEILGSTQIPSLQCVFTRGHQETVLWITHPKSPRHFRNWKLRNEQLMDLSKKVSSDLRPSLVIGDLNTSPWSAWFEALKTHRLRDSREGYGIHGTWPARLPFFFRIPLDHILISSEVRVLEHRVLKEIGSDHLPVCARFGIIEA